MKLFIVSLLFTTCMVYDAIAQKAAKVAEYRAQLREGQWMIDNAAAELIKIKSDPTANDSQKVEIVLILAEAGCSICIEYLVDNYDQFFSYGDGVSDGDQARQDACAFSIEMLKRNDENKWKLVVPFLSSLKIERDNRWLKLASGYLSYILSKPGFKALVEKEIENNNWTDNDYKQNLQKIITMLSN
ncbi:MAG: hypothetical protein ACKVU2_09365 [Saprospiraceae bacterium]